MTAKKPAPAPYHVMIRNIGMVENPQAGIFSAASVDEHVKTWVDKGYEVAFSYPMGRQVIEGLTAPVEGIYFLFKYVG